VELRPVGNPNVVQLHACGPHQGSYEYPNSDGVRIGIFTETLALALALARVGDMQVNWVTIMDWVRRRVLTLVPTQRPEVLGPSNRALFDVMDADPITTLPAIAVGGGRLRLDGGPLLGVHIGHEFIVMPAGASIPDHTTKIGDARVASLMPTAALADLRLSPPYIDVPQGARAHWARAVARAIPVNVPNRGPYTDQLAAAISASTLLRLTEPLESSQLKVLADSDGLLTIHDHLGPVTEPWDPSRTGIHRFVVHLERLARATTLRSLTADLTWALDVPVTVEWGRIIAGQRSRLDNSGAVLSIGDRVYVQVRNDSAVTVYASLIDIGVDAQVRVLTTSAPSGIRLLPGSEYTVGYNELTGALAGMEVSWPRDLDPRLARQETVLVFLTSAPQDSSLAVEVQGGARRLAGSPFEQILAQISTGSTRDVGTAIDDTARFAVQTISFNVHPAPSFGSEIASIPRLGDLAAQRVDYEEARHPVRQVVADDLTSDGEATMMRAAPLRELCLALRYDTDVMLTEEVVTLIEADVQEYRARFLTKPVPQLPPEPLRELLPLMGWLIYEATWAAVQRVDAAFESLGPTEREKSEVAFAQIERLANCARALVWPHYAPRALGAIRAQALAESKRDTEAGYDAAYVIHREARERHRSYRDALGGVESGDSSAIGLDEVLLQLALAETGTACRTAERVISRWSEDITDNSASNEERWIQRMYRELSEATDVGQEALDAAERIKSTYGLVHEIDENRMALVTWMRNPGIMTARAALLALALTPAMEHLRRIPRDGRSWAQERALLIERFIRAYSSIEGPVIDSDGELVPMRFEHRRALIQLRLNLSLLLPGHSLPAKDQFHPCLVLNPLDNEATEALSQWLLTEQENSRGRNYADAIGSATLPLFIQSVMALRSLYGDGDGYLRWRQDRLGLDRHAAKPGRRGKVLAALAAAERRGPLRISGQ
jgi:hypothetical protein